MNPKLRRLSWLRSLPGWVFFIVSPLLALIGNAFDIRVIVSSGNTEVQEIWNFLATPHGTVALMVFGLLWLAALVWWPENAPNHIGTVASHVTAPEVRGQPPAIKVARQGRPNLVCLGTQIVRVRQSRDMILYEGGEELMVATVIFGNEVNPPQRVAPLRNLRAHIVYHGIDSDFNYRVNNASWLGNDQTYTSLDVGDAGKLIIAVMGSKGLCGTYENHYTSDSVFGSSYSPLIERLMGKVFRVEVHLIGGEENEMFSVFEFKLMAEPEFTLLKWEQVEAKINDKEKSLKLAKKLNELLEDGDGLLKMRAETAIPLVNVVVEWEANVKVCIQENLGEAKALEWSKAYPITPFPGPAINRDLVNRLYTLLQRLGEIISEVNRV